MPKENKDRDAITSKAIGIASEKERDAYIDQACGDAAELKRQVEERVAAHFHSNNQKKPDHADDTDAPPAEQAPKQTQEGRGHDMPKENKDRDAITSKAIGIASEKERDAYIDQACGDDTELKRQVEEKVAAHFQSNGQKKPDRAADTDAASAEQAPKQTRKGRARELWQWSRQHPHVSTTAMITLFVLLVATAASVSWAVWALHKEGKALKAEQKASQKQKEAEKSEAKTKGQLHLSEASRKAVEKKRDRAQEEEKKAQRSEKDTRAILDFFQDKLLSAGRPAEGSIEKSFWPEVQAKDKDITLHQAVDAAASQVGEAFADRPLAEASVREILGMTYMNVGDAAKAVKQYERALALREAIQGVNHRDSADCRTKLAVAYRRAGRTTEADRLINRNPNSPAHAAALAVRGALLLAQKKPDEAELKLRACLTIRQKTQPDDWTIFDTKSMLGEALVQQKKYADAEPLLLSGYDGLKEHEAEIPSQEKTRFTKAIERLVQLYEAWGKKDEEMKWRKELEAAEAAKKS